MLDDTSSGFWSRGLQHASDLLIRRGTAMGPLVPVLFLIPFFLSAAYVFSDSTWLSYTFAIVAIGIVASYIYHYAKFAKSDPDRLQSEEYRYEMKKIQMVSGKGLPYPVPADSLNLPDATSNPAHPLPNLKDINIESDSSLGEGKQ